MLNIWESWQVKNLRTLLTTGMKVTCQRFTSRKQFWHATMRETMTSRVPMIWFTTNLAQLALSELKSCRVLRKSYLESKTKKGMQIRRNSKLFPRTGLYSREKNLSLQLHVQSILPRPLMICLIRHEIRACHVKDRRCFRKTLNRKASQHQQS